MSRPILGASLGAVALGLGLFAAPADAAGPTTFSVLIENVSTDTTLPLPGGGATKVPLAPGIVVVHRGSSPLFAPGSPAGAALERLAEDGDPEPLLAAVEGASGVSMARIFIPGQPFEVHAAPGERLAFATMFVQSNDLFYGFRDGHIVLFDAAGRPVAGDHTVDAALFDAGTEVNQPPGVGPDQAPRQTAKNTGPDESGVVRAVADGYAYPAPNAVIRVILAGS